MVKLLARLIEPTDGRVLLDGRDIRELPLKALRKTIGMVPQEPMLFSDTIARNIAFGKVATPLAEIESAARIAGLDRDIAVMPHGFDTVVGERGMSLSGGQKQRVTIARLLNLRPCGRGARRRPFQRRYRDRTGGAAQPRGERQRPHDDRGRPSRVNVRDADHIVVLDDGRSPSAARTKS